MAIWSDLAQWRGPSPNVSGAMSEWRGVVLHIAEGSYEGTISWCLNSASEISAHFVSAKSGAACQIVDTGVTAWTQAAGNGHWLSIEFEGYSGQSLTAGQIEFAARVLARANAVYGVPLQLTDSPSGRGLGWHGMGGAAWGGHTNCPGSPIVAQRGQILARAQQLAGGGGDDDMEMTDQMTMTRYYPGGLQNATEVHSVAEVWSMGTQAALVAMGAANAALAKVNAVAADVTAIKNAPAPSPTLTAEQLAAIGQAAAEQAIAAMGALLAQLEAKMETIIAARVAAASAETDALT